MKTDQEVLSYPLDHLELMNRPHLWPRWPVLPIKRWHADTHTMDTALIVEAEGDSVLFYRNANMYQRPGEWGVPEHRTTQELVAAGWIVD